MAEYIEREALQRCRFIQDKWGEWILAEDIINLPAADVRENKRGKWKVKFPIAICSECGESFDVHGYLNFCPNCGADMREEQT